MLARSNSTARDVGRWQKPVTRRADGTTPTEPGCVDLAGEGEVARILP